MKFLLIGFKLSIGIEQYLISLKKALEVNGKKVELCGDKNQMIKLGGNPISNSSSTINIILDTFNPGITILLNIFFGNPAILNDFSINFAQP